MKKFINFIILLAILYLAYLIYIGDGVVDFNSIWGELKVVYSGVKGWILQVFHK